MLPSVVRLLDGTLVAMVEPIKHIFIRSTDGGKTWSKPYIGVSPKDSGTLNALGLRRDGRLMACSARARKTWGRLWSKNKQKKSVGLMWDKPFGIPLPEGLGAGKNHSLVVRIHKEDLRRGSGKRSRLSRRRRSNDCHARKTGSAQDEPAGPDSPNFFRQRPIEYLSTRLFSRDDDNLSCVQDSNFLVNRVKEIPGRLDEYGRTPGHTCRLVR